MDFEGAFIVRGLYRWGVLQTVDYLSTVSGGGYIGSHVADVYRLGEQAKLLAPGNPEGVERLRKRGRFLTPTGSLGEWLQGFGGLGAGVLWNTAVFVVLALVLAARREGRSPPIWALPLDAAALREAGSARWPPLTRTQPPTSSTPFTSS